MAEQWADDRPFVQRAAVAAVCEPPLLRDPGAASRALAIVDGVTAAAAGAIAGAAFVLGRRAIVDVPTALLCLATLVVLTRVKGISEPGLILGAGVLGIMLTTFAS